MEPSEILKSVEQASRWTWEAWFAASVLVTISSVFFAGKWLVKKHDAAMAELDVSRHDNNSLLREMIDDSKNTNRLLAVSLDRNTTALGENSRVLERMKEKL